jgi:hypothetical protein
MPKAAADKDYRSLYTINVEKSKSGHRPDPIEAKLRKQRWVYPNNWLRAIKSNRIYERLSQERQKGSL